jgi:hypothetical protein
VVEPVVQDIEDGQELLFGGVAASA